jgi:hypothetical protein
VNEEGSAVRSQSAGGLIENAENLALVKQCIDCTLSQLLDTGRSPTVEVMVEIGFLVLSIHLSSRLISGVLHADPHGK